MKILFFVLKNPGGPLAPVSLDEVPAVDTGVVSRRQAPHVEARISGTETCLHPASSPGMTPDQAPKASAQVMLGWKGHGLSTLKFLWSDTVAAGPSPQGVGEVMLGWKGPRTFR